MSKLGQQFDISKTLIKSCEALVCSLNGKAGYDVNECRYKLFCSRNLQNNQLPPCRAALKKHIQRANYQAAIWRHALEAKPTIPDSAEHGSTVVEGDLTFSCNGYLDCSKWKRKCNGVRCS
ncbi:UNVERIFIED_CONTAM: hypothetical protein FKN15_047819 [Acipenser sinensis]